MSRMNFHSPFIGLIYIQCFQSVLVSNYCLNIARYQKPFVLVLVYIVVSGVLCARRNRKDCLFLNRCVFWYLFQTIIIVSVKLLFLSEADVAFVFNLSVLNRLKSLHISDWCHAVCVRQCIRLCLMSVVFMSSTFSSHALCVSLPFIHVHDWVTYVVIFVWLRGFALL